MKKIKRTKKQLKENESIFYEDLEMRDMNSIMGFKLLGQKREGNVPDLHTSYLSSNNISDMESGGFL